MKRRDFIKAFGAVSASLPIASALAKVDGTDKVIETFQMSDIETEVIHTNGFLFAKEEKEFNEKPSIINIEIYTIPLILSPDLKTIKYYFNNSNLIHFFSKDPILGYVNEVDKIQGIKRGTRIIGLPEYWYHPNFYRMINVVQERELIIMSARQYFVGNYE